MSKKIFGGLIEVNDSDPAKDPSHPKSLLQPRHAGDVFGRLIRGYGLRKGFRLYGVFQACVSDRPEVRQAVFEKSRHALFADLEALKAVNLAPDNLHASEMVAWLNKWFNAGFDSGMMASGFVDEFRLERKIGETKKALE